MCLNTDLGYRNPPHIATGTLYIYISHLPSVRYFESLWAETQRQMQSRALCCSDPLSSQTYPPPPQEQKDTGATIRSCAPEHSEGRGGSIGNIFPVLSAPPIALKCKKISCDSFDMKQPPVLLKCCWIGGPELTIFL